MLEAIRMEPQRKLFPIGMQTFSNIINENRVYIDKTGYVYKMTHSASKYVFLSRPRRFGKSLLASTLRSYFQGDRELFAGLAIENLEKDWIQYPVLHFDMSLGKHMDEAALNRYILYVLEENEKRLGVEAEGEDANVRLATLIRGVYEKYGKPAVVLIDEYDAPLLDVVHEEKNLPALRRIIRNFYSPLKACDPYLRFVFITGITKFSQLSIFSELNNITNISMHEDYAAICGITEEEMRSQLGDDIEALALKMGVTNDEAVSKLKEHYDGYHFTWPSQDIYNPYSLMSALDQGKIESFWFGSGTPTYLIEMLKKFSVAPQEIGPYDSFRSEFDSPTENVHSIVPLLYQSGYITIKGFDDDIAMYTLDIPNTEVRMGLMESLLPQYVEPQYVGETNRTIAFMARDIRNGEIDSALGRIKEFLLTIPKCDNTDYEGHYQSLLYTIFSLLGLYADVEVRTSRGRVDMVLRTSSILYVIELKIIKSAIVALEQINLMDYPSRFRLSGLPIVKVGINFDCGLRTIDGWTKEPLLKNTINGENLET